MIQLLYTNSEVFNSEQPNASTSLGGNVSSSIVPNDFLGNVFSDISNLSKQSGRKETILIAFSNDAVAITDLKVKFLLPTNPSIDIRVAFANPTYNDCGEPIFEKIANSSALPYSATFTPVVNNTELTVGAVDANKTIGMWLTRTVNTTNSAPLSCEELEEEFLLNTPTPTEETVSLEITFN